MQRRRDGSSAVLSTAGMTEADRDAAVLDAVRTSTRLTSDDGYAHPTVMAMRAGVSRTTIIRWAKAAESRGLVESAVVYGWRYSKAVRSIRFRLPS